MMNNRPFRQPAWAKDIEEWTRDIEETLKINPAAHSHKVNKSRSASFKYALAGILHVVRYQRSAHVQGVVTIIVFTLSFVLQIPKIEFLLIVLAAGLVWTTELINAAIESAVNLATTEYHPMARVAKDVASGAALIALFTSLMVGLPILIPAVIEKL